MLLVHSRAQPIGKQNYQELSRDPEFSLSRVTGYQGIPNWFKRRMFTKCYRMLQAVFGDFERRVLSFRKCWNAYKQRQTSFGYLRYDDCWHVLALEKCNYPGIIEGLCFAVNDSCRVIKRVQVISISLADANAFCFLPWNSIRSSALRNLYAVITEGWSITLGFADPKVDRWIDLFAGLAPVTGRSAIGYTRCPRYRTNIRVHHAETRNVNPEGFRRKNPWDSRST